MMPLGLPDIIVNMENIIVSPDTTAHMVCMAVSPQT